MLEVIVKELDLPVLIAFGGALYFGASFLVLGHHHNKYTLQVSDPWREVLKQKDWPACDQYRILSRQFLSDYDLTFKFWRWWEFWNKQYRPPGKIQLIKGGTNGRRESIN